MGTPRTLNEVERSRKIRHTRKVQRFDTPTPACIFCGCDRIEALRAVPFAKLPEHLKRKVIERHHPDDRDISEWIIPLCRNCHAIESDAQEDLPDSLRRPQTKLERAAAMLTADARVFQQLAEAFQRRCMILEREAEALLRLPTKEAEV